MAGFTRKICILICILALNLPVYTQEIKEALNKEPSGKTKTSIKNTQTQKKEVTKKEEPQKDRSFLNWFNSEAYAAPKSKYDKKALRKRWEQLLGIDIFMPYFQAKKAQKWIKDRTRTKFFNFRGRAEFDEDQVKYIFKLKF